MGVLSDAFADDAAAFCDPDLFGEPVSLLVAKTGLRVLLNLVVFRQPVASVVGTGKPASPAPNLQVFVPRSANPALGLCVRPVENADIYRIANQPGGTATTDHVLNVIAEEDAGGWMLSFGKVRAI